jgi:antitoxin MazE
MKMHVGKWGNSLAVRLPRDIVEKFGIKEGDDISGNGFVADLEAQHADAIQARRDAAMEEIRKRAFPLPDDWKFDREEANWRSALDKW